MQLQQNKDELESLNIDIAVVTFETTAIAQKYARESGFSWPILIDESRQLYAAYGMERGGSWAIFGPSSWGGYVKLLLRGRKLRRPTGDVHQLGGDVLIDPSGVVQVHHVGQKPVDRPSVESLLDVVRNQSPGESDQGGN